MDIYELHKKINIVLDEEVRSYSANGRIRGGLGSMNVALQSVPNDGRVFLMMDGLTKDKSHNFFLTRVIRLLSALQMQQLS